MNDVAEGAFRRHYDHVYRYVRRRTRDHHRAEDLTQQVFAEAVTGLRESSSPQLAWLYTVAQRRFADAARRETVARRASGLRLVPGEESREYGSEAGAALRSALDRLPAGQREVVVLKLLRGARFAEIGERLGISTDAAKMRFTARARGAAHRAGGGGIAAMTLRDAEVIELLADKPELLAIADAVSATQREPAAVRPLRRRIAVRGGLVAAAAAAAIVAVLAWPQGQPGGVIGKALAAIGSGPIMHVVTEAPSGLTYVNLKTGHRTSPVFREELWADRQADRFHLVLSLNGRVLGDVLWPQDSGSGTTPFAADNPAFVALWTGYRTALKNGAVTLAGRGTFRGHAVYWLRFKATSQTPARYEVGVDVRTFKPVVYRTVANGRRFDQRILVAKATAYRAADFKRRGPSLVGAGSTSQGGSATAPVPVGPSAPPPPVVHAPWLTAGTSVVGLQLRSAESLTVSSTIRGKHTSVTGIELTYGPLRHGAPSPLTTTIDELPRPDDPRPWRYIPAGTIQIQRGEESGSGGSHTLWTGQLRKHGLYITIETPRGERALLEIARALHPAG